MDERECWQVSKMTRGLVGGEAVCRGEEMKKQSSTESGWGPSGLVLAPPGGWSPSPSYGARN